MQFLCSFYFQREWVSRWSDEMLHFSAIVCLLASGQIVLGLLLAEIFTREKYITVLNIIIHISYG